MKLCVAFLLLFALATAWGEPAADRTGSQPQASYDYGQPQPQPQPSPQPDDCPCNATPQFDPVCGTDGVTYNNMQLLKCASRCRKNVAVRFRGSC